MSLFSRNVAIVMVLLVALHATLAAPANKDGDGKGGKKGRRSVQEEEVGVDGLSALEGSFADALAEDAEAALVLEDQVRARRSLSAVEGDESMGAYLEGDASADGAALQVEGEGTSQLMQKKPCRGRKGGSGGNTNSTESTGEADEMQRQREDITTESSALVSWLIGGA